LRDLLPDFPTGKIEETESPDFVVGAPDGSIGIEVCEYFRPERSAGAYPVEQEALRQRIVDRASQICAERGIRGLLVPVTFRRDIRILKQHVDATATALVDAIELGNHHDFDEHPTASCIDGFWVHDIGEKHEATFTRADTTWPPPLNIEELTRIITAKESKLAAYRRRCTRVWLLIVIDGFRVSSVIETPETWPKVASTFDRVLVLLDRRIVARVDA
jgi:hypothetical protein